MKALVEMNCEHNDDTRKPVEQYVRDQYLRELDGWQLINQGKGIECSFKFKNYYHTMSFVNAIAWIANKEAHHPDLEVSYGTCKVIYTTHDMDGLGINDLICAAKISAFSQSGNFGPVVQS